VPVDVGHAGPVAGADHGDRDTDQGAAAASEAAERAAAAKAHEIEAHRRAITFQEEAAAAFERAGEPDRAEQAHARAEQARQRLQLALVEQAEEEAGRPDV
jgi:hypothetical protein